ncbi:Lactate utilization protein B [Lysinibacillus sphaericus]
MEFSEPPSHIVVPALHKNKEQIRDIFKEKQGYEQTEKPEELALYVREKLRNEYLTADIGITGCNFAIAEKHPYTLVTNEGNADLVTALPKTQITVMGMERIVPTLEEMEVLVSLLTRSAVGQKLTSYITTLTGVKDEGDTDGQDELHLVIVDNGRSAILGGNSNQFCNVFAVQLVLTLALYTVMLVDIGTVRFLGSCRCCVVTIARWL